MLLLLHLNVGAGHNVPVSVKISCAGLTFSLLELHLNCCIEQLHAFSHLQSLGVHHCIQVEQAQSLQHCAKNETWKLQYVGRSRWLAPLLHLAELRRNRVMEWTLRFLNFTTTWQRPIPPVCIFNLCLHKRQTVLRHYHSMQVPWLCILWRGRYSAKLLAFFFLV